MEAPPQKCSCGGALLEESLAVESVDVPRLVAVFSVCERCKISRLLQVLRREGGARRARGRGR